MGTATRLSGSLVLRGEKITQWGFGSDFIKCEILKADRKGLKIWAREGITCNVPGEEKGNSGERADSTVID